MKTKIIEIYINPSWTYKEILSNIKTLKASYQGQLASFSMWETKEWADFIVATRNKFYALQLTEKKIEKLWKYMNGNYPFHSL